MNKYLSYAILGLVSIGALGIVYISARSFAQIVPANQSVLPPKNAASTSGQVTNQTAASTTGANSIVTGYEPRTPYYAGEMDVFVAIDRTERASNVVGYLGSGGSFVMDVPDWIVDHWRSDTGDGDVFTFTPKDNVDLKDFSDIGIFLQSTTEQYNASTLYDMERSSKTGLILAEVLLNDAGDMRIYHVERFDGDMISDDFYMDGNSKTAKVQFYSDKFAHDVAGTKVREFVEGFGVGHGPQG